MSLMVPDTTEQIDALKGRGSAVQVEPGAWTLSHISKDTVPHTHSVAVSIGGLTWPLLRCMCIATGADARPGSTAGGLLTFCLEGILR